MKYEKIRTFYDDTSNNFTVKAVLPADIDVSKYWTTNITTLPDSTTINNNSFYNESTLDYLLSDIINQKAKQAEEELEKIVIKNKKNIIDDFTKSIKKVYFNKPYTVVIWEDNTKTVVKCQRGDTYDKEKGLALAIIKHWFGDISYFNTIFTKWLEEDED